MNKYIEISQFLVGLGDAIAYSKVIENYKKKDQSKMIKFNTYFPELFKYDPYIDEIHRMKWKGKFPTQEEIVNPFKIADWKGKNLTSLLCISAGFDNNVYNSVPNYFIEQEEINIAKDFLFNHNCKIIIHARGINTNPNLGYSGSLKNWPLEKWRELVKLIPEPVISIGTKDDLAIEGVLDYRGKLSLRESISLIYCSNFFITCDSSFYHISANFPTKRLLLLGERHNPKSFCYPNDFVLVGSDDCKYKYCDQYFNCTKTISNFIAPCIQSISVVNVLNALGIY